MGWRSRMARVFCPPMRRPFTSARRRSLATDLAHLFAKPGKQPSEVLDLVILLDPATYVPDDGTPATVVTELVDDTGRNLLETEPGEASEQCYVREPRRTDGVLARSTETSQTGRHETGAGPRTR